MSDPPPTKKQKTEGDAPATDTFIDRLPDGLRVELLEKLGMQNEAEEHKELKKNFQGLQAQLADAVSKSDHAAVVAERDAAQTALEAANAELKKLRAEVETLRTTFTNLRGASLKVKQQMNAKVAKLTMMMQQVADFKGPLHEVNVMDRLVDAAQKRLVISIPAPVAPPAAPITSESSSSSSSGAGAGAGASSSSG